MDLLAKPATKRPSIGRFAKFALVGGFGVIVNLGILHLLVQGFGWAPALAAVLSIEASSLSNYFLNRLWTWRDRDASWWSLLTYHLVSLLGMVAQWSVLYFGTTWLGLHYLPAALAGIAVATAWNFFVNHFLTFTRFTPERKEAAIRVAMYTGSFVLMLGLAAGLSHDWDTFVFQKTVEDFLNTGQTPYETAAENPSYSYFGVALPPQPRWYAYPPLPLLVMSLTYAPVALGAAATPWLARVLIKLPFVVGLLAVAWLGRRLALGGPDPIPRTRALRLEAFILFNPLLLIVAGIWGQFESLMAAFMLLAFLAVRRDRWSLGGLAWGAALLIKIFPLYLLPLLATYAWRRGRSAAVLQFFGAGFLLFLLVSLPFYWMEPAGFVEQVFGMHAGRTPGRFAPVAFLYELLKWLSGIFPGVLPDDVGLSRSLSLFSFLLTVGLLGVVLLAALARPATEKNLVWFSGVSMLAGLLATKVVSEQYMVFPVVLLTVARFRLSSQEDERPRRFLWAVAWLAFLAAFFDSFFFLTYVPEDVALWLLGMPVPDAILAVAHFLGITVTFLHVGLSTIAILGLLIPFYFAVRLIGPEVGAGLSVFGHAIHRFVTREAVHWSVRGIAVLFVVCVLVPPLTVGVLTPKREPVPEDRGVVGESPVLLSYRTDWFNPTNRPDVAGGRWAEARFTSTTGYYNSMGYKMSQDFQTIRGMRVQGLVLPFHPAFPHPCMGATTVAARLGLPYALEVDLRHVADRRGGVELTPDAADRAREMFLGPWFDYWSSPFNVRLTPDGGRVLFVDGVHRVRPTFTDSERQYVGRELLPLVAPTLAASLQGRFGNDAWRMAPTDESQLAAPEAAPWRSAYAEARVLWWKRAFSFGDDSTRLAVYTDADPGVPSSVLGVHAFAGRVQPVPFHEDAPQDEAADYAFHWISAQPDRPEAYEEAWQARFQRGGGGVLISWNDFDLGQGIEPTLEYGDELLRLTNATLARSQ